MNQVGKKSQFSRLAMTRVAFVIDKLESGGTQRQLVMLAAALADRGYEVETLVYHQNDFFADDLIEIGLPISYVSSRNKVHLVYAMRRAIKISDPDVVISYLPGPNALTGLIGLPRRNYGFIASERCLDVVGRWKSFVRYGLHFLADAVVCNSHSQYHHILEVFPSLMGRTHMVMNGVDLKRFSPFQSLPNRPEELQILVLARIHPQKNPFTLVEAVEIVRRERPQVDLMVNWYGDPCFQMEKYYERLKEVIERKSLKGIFCLHRAINEVEKLYHTADVVCLPSLYEGTSNVICEAMASGLPLLASRAGDTPRLVEEGRNGLLFDASSARDMADVILQFIDLPYESKREMGLEGRKMIEEICSLDTLVDCHLEIIEKVLK